MRYHDDPSVFREAFDGVMAKYNMSDVQLPVDPNQHHGSTSLNISVLDPAAA